MHLIGRRKHDMVTEQFKRTGKIFTGGSALVI